MDKNIKITWYGRCCFLVDIAGKKVLFDPYDMFVKIDIGYIESDILLSSSTWHDHGHIGASPGSHIYSYAGEYTNSDIKITGIESKEDRGTPNVIFNIQYGDFSITNFADFGPTQEKSFDANATEDELKVLRSTNIAFARPMIEREEVGENNVHNEDILKYCEPNIIFPEHYHPRSFITEQIPEDTQRKFEPANVMVDELPEAIDYPIEEIDDYQVMIESDDLKEKRTVCRFMKVHPQVKYRQELELKRNW